ncbi:TIGR04255 family protein [Actinoplanes sp. RD1]|uniref:TIGR04255 family protein n=1 Tax=Actinoplanes sp. RD1 TaxID=3064538 RepID=UPI0027420C48|nr:TIGR04255 family protein [Actinoplanes sp. RD1]
MQAQTGTVADPFGSEPVAEVPLAGAPLARVLTQVRFPRLTALATGPETAHAFAAAMSRDFPILQERREVAVTITPEGVSPAAGAAQVWQLQSADERWQVSFGDTFLALHTSAYSSRTEFVARLVEAWQQFTDVVRPPFVERIGLRYINRLEHPSALGELPALIRADALGEVGAVVGGRARLTHSIHEALYHLDDANGLQARWGLLPGGALLDPALPPVDGSSWVLDLDSFRQGRHDVAPEEVEQHLYELAERAYRYFRWMVTPYFLTRFRGDGA